MDKEDTAGANRYFHALAEGLDVLTDLGWLPILTRHKEGAA